MIVSIWRKLCPAGLFVQLENIVVISIVIMHVTVILECENMPFRSSPSSIAYMRQWTGRRQAITTAARRDEKHLSFGIWCDLWYRFNGILE